MDSVFESHRTRIVPVDQEVARVWARICADAQKTGKPPAAVDSLIAASALSRGLTLVTRNVEDFKRLPLGLTAGSAG